MDSDLPPRIFRAGEEPEVKQINNNCRLSILEAVKTAFPTEYNQVKEDPVFSHIFAICENELHYSAKLIHSIMCRQIDTAKRHELWFVFGKRPLRFSLQEFHAVTGLKYHKDENCNVEKWVDDKQFWSKLLKTGSNICLLDIRDKHIVAAEKWKTLDRLRLVYLCVIAGVLLPMDEKKAIPHTYIKMLMDFDKLRAYPWGLMYLVFSSML